MKNVRYGILGTARIIDRFVAAVESSDFGEVSAIASRDLEKARLRAGKRIGLDQKRRESQIYKTESKD